MVIAVINLLLVLPSYLLIEGTYDVAATAAGIPAVAPFCELGAIP